MAPVADARDGLRTGWFDPEEGGAGQGSLLPGTPGVVVARLAETAPEVLVPARAVGHRDGHGWVLRRQGAASAETPVELVLLSGGEALVRGLRVGDWVAAEAPAGSEPADGGDQGRL